MTLLRKLETEYEISRDLLLCLPRANLLLHAADIAYQNAIYQKLREDIQKERLSSDFIERLLRMDDAPQQLFMRAKDRKLLSMEGDTIRDNVWNMLLYEEKEGGI